MTPKNCLTRCVLSESIGVCTVLRLVLIGTLLFAAVGNDKAQFPSASQADSPEEFDDYLLVLSKKTPRDVISAAEKFEHHWPRSQLLAQVYEKELEAYRALGDSARAIQAGEKALQAAPDNLAVLANLAYIIANGATEPQRLARAEEYACKEIELSKNFRVPRWILPQEWDEIQGRLGSAAHSALGLVAYKRGDIAGAIRQFETAAGLAPAPDPALHYRLGMLYRAGGNESRAVEELQKAAASTDPTLRRLAERELRAMRP